MNRQYLILTLLTIFLFGGDDQVLAANPPRMFEGICDQTVTTILPDNKEPTVVRSFSYVKGNRYLMETYAPTEILIYQNITDYKGYELMIVVKLATGEVVGYKSVADLSQANMPKLVDRLNTGRPLDSIKKYGVTFYKHIVVQDNVNTLKVEREYWASRDIYVDFGGIRYPLILKETNKYYDKNGNLTSTSIIETVDLVEQIVSDKVFVRPADIKVFETPKLYESYVKKISNQSDYESLVIKEKLMGGQSLLSGYYPKKSVATDPLSSSATSSIISNSGDGIPKELRENYRRSSIYSAYLSPTDKQLKYKDEIEYVFLKLPVPDQYNDHDLPLKSFPIAVKGGVKDNIDQFLDDHGIAKYMVAKWFNRNAQGQFDMNLVFDRGKYDASYQDVLKSDLQTRRDAILADAGMGLLPYTFLLVNDIRYVDKEEAGRIATAVLLGLAGVAAGVAAGYSGSGQNQQLARDISNTVSSVASLGALVSTILSKGFTVRINSYLYRLDWNNELADTFFNKYWIEAGQSDLQKRHAFDNDGSEFKLVYVGKQSVLSDVQSTIFSAKTNEELFTKTVADALDKVVVKLQKKNESFRAKAPLVSNAPFMAHIGLKEGVTKSKKYYLYQPYQAKEKDPITYKHIATLRPIADKIWDNRYMASEMKDAGNYTINATYFDMISGNQNRIVPGLLLSEGKMKSKK